MATTVPAFYQQRSSGALNSSPEYLLLAAQRGLSVTCTLCCRSHSHTQNQTMQDWSKFNLYAQRDRTRAVKPHECSSPPTDEMSTKQDAASSRHAIPASGWAFCPGWGSLPRCRRRLHCFRCPGTPGTPGIAGIHRRRSCRRRRRPWESWSERGSHGVDARRPCGGGG